MKKSITKKLLSFVLILLLSISFSIISCNKNAGKKDPEKTPVDTVNIIYTDVTPDSIIINNQKKVFQLDVNNDGTNDFTFNLSIIVFCEDDLLGAIAYRSALTVTPATKGNDIITTARNWALPLDSLTKISKDSLWSSNTQTIVDGKTYSTGHCNSVGLPTVGYWISVNDKYLGLRFSKGGNIYYGWARISSSYSIVSPVRSVHVLASGPLILKDYAYNSVPNQPILAGQTK